MTKSVLPIRITALLLLLGWGSASCVFGQGVKSLINFNSFGPTIYLSANEVLVDEQTGDFLIGGAVKAGAPGYQAMGYMIRTDYQGIPISHAGIRTNSGNSVNGVRVSSIAKDDNDQFYLAGSSVPNLFVHGTNNERTLTAIDDDGKVVYSKMQSSHNFESVIFDEERRLIVALSNNMGVSNPNTDVMVSVFETDGTLVDDINISTTTRDSAVKIIQTEGGYIVVAGSDRDNDKQILVVRLDKDLNLEWSREINNQEKLHEVADVAFDNNETIFIAGTSTDVSDGTVQAFATSIDMRGDIGFYNTYQFQSDQEVFGTGLASIPADAEAGGFLLCGYFRPKGTTENRAYVLRGTANGEITWANNYSNYSPYTDYTYSESLSDITFVPDGRQFVAVGPHTRMIGTEIDEQNVVMVRASLGRGNLDDYDVGCSINMEVKTEFLGASARSVGTPYTNRAAFPFGYQTLSLEMQQRYCVGTIFSDGYRKRLISEDMVLYLDYTHHLTPSVRYQWDPALGDGTAELLDIQGRVVGEMALKASEQKADLDLSDLSSGVYFLKVRIGDRYVGMKKLLVQP